MSDILDTIDGALDDYMSPDAMRWSPEPEEAEREWPRGYGGEFLDYRRRVILGFDGSEDSSAGVVIYDEFRQFIHAMDRVTSYLAELAGIPMWLRTPAPPELTNDTLRLLAEAPRDAAIATTVETSYSDEPIPVVVQPPEVTMPESPKVQAAIERWSDEGRRR